MDHTHLPHYYDLLNKKTTAYYLICKNLLTKWDKNADIDKLWSIHVNLAVKFKELIEIQSEKNQIFDLNTIDKKINETSFLDLKIEIVNKMLEKCEFCENLCKINRRTGKTGRCGIPDSARVSSAFLHGGEESPLCPSGTIFFSGCTFECVFCQNYDIATAGKREIPLRGGIVDEKQIANFAQALIRNSARNINYVGGDPTPNLHVILESLKYQSNNICQLWNSNFYNSLPVIELLIEVMDLWLPDFKYGCNECGEKYSGVKNYWDILTRNLKYIYDWGSRDVIIRHLVMPGHIECCTEPILKWIAKEIPDVVVNIMGQYHPDYLVNERNFPEINKRVSRIEMTRAFTLAEDLGIEYRLVS